MTKTDHQNANTNRHNINKKINNPIYTRNTQPKPMWLILFLLFFEKIQAHTCCSTCACAQRCQTPSIQVDIDLHGLTVNCPNATCACVIDELDTCTYGDTWSEMTNIAWSDARWHKCIQVEHYKPLMARALIRWWHGHCIGHAILEIELDIEPVARDLYVDFNVLAYFEHDLIHNVFRIKTMSGSNDVRPIVGSSEMFFETTLLDEHTGIHVEITNCTVQIIEGSAVNAPIINERNVYDPTRIEYVNDTTKMTYDAFWDYDTNSPFQRLVCSYALFNGTSSVLHHTTNRTYMMANPDETGILVNDVDDVIINQSLSN